ncbi:MAG: hypothetical protein Q9M16_04220 [Mariprofundus sp.]|nr:hypothetical protein [Mariprofundus sp.]
MPAYLKMEESNNDVMHAKNIMDGFMDASLLALLIAPLAVLALALHHLDVAVVTQNILIASASILLLALPQFVRWLRRII